MSERDAVRNALDFVEGRLAARDFEALLYDDAGLEGVLSNDPDLPPGSYVGRSVHQYLLRQDFGHPRSVLNAQGAVSEWLSRHHVPHKLSGAARSLHDLLAASQPKWLSLDVKYFEESFVRRADGRSGAELRAWLRTEILRTFRYAKQPPKWIQSPAWPIGPSGPLVFLGQLAVKQYFHDAAAVYVFHDADTRKCTTVLQVG